MESQQTYRINVPQITVLAPIGLAHNIHLHMCQTRMTLHVMKWHVSMLKASSDLQPQLLLTYRKSSESQLCKFLAWIAIHLQSEAIGSFGPFLQNNLIKSYFPSLSGITADMFSACCKTQTTLQEFEEFVSMCRKVLWSCFF